MSLRNLLIQLSVQVTGQSRLEATDNAMTKLLRTTEAVGSALKGFGAILAGGAAISGIVGFIENNLTLADALYNQAAKLGMTTDELQKYQYAAQEMGITTAETSVAIRFFNRAIGEAQLGTKSAVKTFAQLGMLKDVLDPMATTSDLLLKFSDRLEKIPSQGERTAFVMRALGRGGSALLPVLQLGSKKLKEVFEDIDELGGGYDQAFAKSAHDMDVIFKKIRLGWRSIAAAIMKEVMPALNWLALKTIVIEKAFIYLSKHTYGFRTALIFLAATLAALSLAFVAAMAVWMPWLTPIVAAFTVLSGIVYALYIAFDDFYTFLQGGDSLLGRFLDQLNGPTGAKHFRDEIVGAFKDVEKAFAAMTGSSDDLGKSLLKTFLESIPSIIKWSGVFSSDVLWVLVETVREVKVLAAALQFAFTGDYRNVVENFKKMQDKIDAANAEAKPMLDALDRLERKFSDIDKPNPVGSDAPTMLDIGPKFFPDVTPETEPFNPTGLPPPPPPPPEVHVHLHNVPAGVGATVTKGQAEIHRDTQRAVWEGMPSTNQ